jgi:hypothetical protein
MKIFKVNDSIIRIGDLLLPFGTFKLDLNDNDTTFNVYDLNNQLLQANVRIADCERENTTKYNTLYELLDEIKECFSQSASNNNNNGGGGNNCQSEFICGQVNNFTDLPDVTLNDGKFYITLHDVTVSGHNKQAGIYLSRNNHWKKVVKFLAIN